jgi:hypothetical protein
MPVATCHAENMCTEPDPARSPLKTIKAVREALSKSKRQAGLIHHGGPVHAAPTPAAPRPRRRPPRGRWPPVGVGG